MDNRLIQTPVNKNSPEFVDRATEIIAKITELMDKCCPACKELLKEAIQQ